MTLSQCATTQDKTFAERVLQYWKKVLGICCSFCMVPLTLVTTVCNNKINANIHPSSQHDQRISPTYGQHNHHRSRSPNKSYEFEMFAMFAS